MNKELTPLEELQFIRQFEINDDHRTLNDHIICRESFNIIEKALKDYEKLAKDFGIFIKMHENMKETWERSIEKEHKALEIIKEKDVDVALLKGILHSDKSLHTASYYNSYFVATYKHITQEEFDLLKEILKTN